MKNEIYNRKVKIKDLTLDLPVALAPMAGVTDLPFRMLCKEQGCGLLCTEMVSATAIYYNNRNTWQLMDIDSGEHPVAVQLFGSDPQIMADMAARVAEESDCDIIDVNMGCPVPKVVNNGEGSALMRRPKLVGEILSAIHRLVGATTLDGVKRRTRAGMGRCQAGFCSPKTLEILSRELHLDPAQITKEGTGSEILTGKNKDTAPGEGGTWKRTQAPVGKEALHE